MFESARRPWTERWFPNLEWVLLIVLAFEAALFGVFSENFLTVGNAFEITRLAAEIGLLAFGMTVVIKTGGIDLSVGSMMGLTAVMLGLLWHSVGLNIWISALLMIPLGIAGGLLNGWLITSLRVPPLIVTLGTLSLFRGLAEAITGGYVAYTGFPASFLMLGQGYLAGVIPTQFLIFLAMFFFAWVLLHRTIFGRYITAIGFGEPGAAYAGVPVGSALRRAYMFSGALAALAGVIYVSHIGQARANAGTGYELLAIAAVVLGGASINGGRGTVHGTLLGLFCLVVLENGLRLAGQPTEVAGILVGLILVAAIAANQLWTKHSRHEQVSLLQTHPHPEAFDMKNSQVALIILAILAGAAVIAASNLFLAKSIKTMQPAGAAWTAGSAAAAPAMTTGAAGGPAKRMTVAVTPKSKSDPYFVSCREGAEEAAREVNADLIWDGPTEPDPAKQNELIEAWITKNVDVIAVSSSSPDSVSTVLRKAREKGIGVITWDADANPDARAFFVNQATSQGIGSALADEGARLGNGKAKYAIITASLTDANQNEWIKFIKERMADKHPEMQLAAIQPCDGQRERAMTEAKNILRAYPDVQVIIAICSPAVPGTAEALKQEQRTEIKLTGLSTPNLCRDYMHEGFIDSIVLWNTKNLGYLTVYTAKALKAGELKPGVNSLKAGRLGEIEVQGDQVRLGQPFVFTPENIDQFHF